MLMYFVVQKEANSVAGHFTSSLQTGLIFQGGCSFPQKKALCYPHNKGRAHRG